jgi:hypothetical protein
VDGGAYWIAHSTDERGLPEEVEGSGRSLAWVDDPNELLHLPRNRKALAASMAAGTFRLDSGDDPPHPDIVLGCHTHLKPPGAGSEKAA